MTIKLTSRRVLPAATALAAIVLLAGCAPSSPAGPPPGATSSEATTARLTEVGQAVLDSGATAFVGTVYDQQNSTSVALGFADRDSGAEAVASDEFQMGSTTKTVTATVALQLVGEGVLSLDDTVERWLPGAVPNGSAITLRMLLQHTSGLFDYASDDAFGLSLFADPMARHGAQDLLAVALTHDPTFAPGEGWAYSNIGFVVVGMMLEAATGQSVADLITERVITPLGLEHTYWGADGQFRDSHLHGYYRTQPGSTDYVDVSSFPLSWADAAGALISTTDDLGAFERALQSGALLEPAELAEMRTTVDIPDTGGQYAYGLGLMRITTPDGYVWGHTGGTLGYLTQAWSTEDGSRSVIENVATAAATPLGPDTEIDGAASAAASSLFDLLFD